MPSSRSVVVILTAIVVLMAGLPTLLVVLATVLTSVLTSPPHTKHSHAPTPAALRHSQRDRLQASAPAIGGVPTVVAAGTAWGVQEDTAHACRVTLGTAYHGATVTVSVTRYNAGDCTPTAGDAAEALKGLLKAQS